MQTARAVLALSASERRLYAAMLFWLLAFRLGDRLLSLKTLRAWVRRFGHRVGRANDPEQEIARVRKALTAVAAQLPGRTTCLPQALSAQLLLARRGVGTDLMVGFLKDDDHLEGRTWLEYLDQMVIGDNGRLARYTTVSELPHHRWHVKRTPYSWLRTE